jgi:hypothetical protein
MSFTGFALPMSSELRPEEVVFYQQHRTGIGLPRSSACSALMMMFAAAISAQLQRIEGRTTPWVFVQPMGRMGNVPFADGNNLDSRRFPAGPFSEVTQAINDLPGLC